MKKNLIALAITGALVTPMTSQAETTVYGKVHLNYGSVQDETGGVVNEDNWQLSSFASRFGVKGSHDLDGGLAAIYKLEWEINLDDADTKDITINNRNQYIGLKGGFGEVRFGTHDTPLKMVQGKFDQFGDTPADLKNAGSHDGENRFANILAYLGKSGNVGYNIALAPGEGDGATAGDGPADTVSASVTFKSGPMYVGVAVDSYDDTGAAAGTENTLARLVGIYKINDMQIGLLLQSGVEKIAASADKETWIGLSFNTKIGGSNKFKAQYIMTEDNAATATETTLIGLGVDHKFSKKATGYVMYSALEEDTGGVTGDEINTFSVGMIVKF